MIGLIKARCQQAAMLTVMSCVTDGDIIKVYIPPLRSSALSTDQHASPFPLTSSLIFLCLSEFLAAGLARPNSQFFAIKCLHVSVKTLLFSSCLFLTIRINKSSNTVRSLDGLTGNSPSERIDKFCANCPVDILPCKRI